MRVSNVSKYEIDMTHIICIEDELDLREEIVFELVNAGYQVSEADDGREGLEKINATRPDIVISDISMPHMTGYDLLREVRDGASETSGIPFIFLTAFSDKVNVVSGKNLGADDYLTKPVDFELLLAAVDSQVKRAERQKQDTENKLHNLRKNMLETFPHELRTPLNSIMAFSEMLKNESYGPLGDSRYNNFAGHINESAQRLNELVCNYLALAEVFLVDSSPQHISCDPLRLIEECVQKISNEAGNKEIEFDITGVSSQSPFETDPEIFSRSLRAVLSNAIKFSSVGDTVTIRSQSNSSGNYQITIEDTGIGIADKDLERIFDIFSQLSDGLAREYEGLGIGLPLACLGVEQLGGTLEIKSTPEVGTTVFINLPCSDLDQIGQSDAEIMP